MLYEVITNNAITIMLRLHNIPVLLMFLFLPVVSLKAQVQVTKSTEKVVIDGKTFYRHTVLKGQTAFSRNNFV